MGMERNGNIQLFHSCRLGKLLSFPWDLNSLGEDAWAVVLLGVFHLGFPSVQAFCRDLTKETCPAFGTPQLSRPGTSTQYGPGAGCSGGVFPDGWVCIQAV